MILLCPTTKYPYLTYNKSALMNWFCLIDHVFNVVKKKIPKTWWWAWFSFFSTKSAIFLVIFSKKLKKNELKCCFWKFFNYIGKTGKMDHFQVLMNRHLFSNGKQNKLTKSRQNTWISCFYAVLPTWNLIFFAKNWSYLNLVHNFHYISKDFWSLQNLWTEKNYSKLVTLQRLELFT